LLDWRNLACAHRSQHEVSIAVTMLDAAIAADRVLNALPANGWIC